MADPKSIPGLAKAGILKRRMPQELISSVPPMIAAVVGAVKLWEDPVTHALAVASCVAAVWLLISSAWKILHAREQDRSAREANGHDGLVGALTVLQSAAAHACGIAEKEMDARLRVTFHRVVEPIDKAEFIEQLIPYVGGTRNGEGRRFSVRSGITGRCIREKAPLTAALVANDEAQRRRELVEQWAYTEHDVRSLSMDRHSAMAIPILSAHGQVALGVVYLDSDQRALFEDVDVQTAILTACRGITIYVNERYAQ